MTELTARPSVVVALALAGAVATLAPPAVALWWGRRSGAPMSAWAKGALVFFVSQCVLRLPWQIPLGIWLAPRIHGSMARGFAWIAASAFTAGLFEEVGRWAGYRWLLKRERSFRVGVMFGLGHGGLESMVLVGFGLVASLVVYLLFASGHAPAMSDEARDKVVAAMTRLQPLDLAAGVAERVMAITAHVALSLVVLQCFVRRSAWWLLAAILGHFALDFVGVGGAVLLKDHGAWAAELAVLPGFLAAIAVILRARRQPPAQADT